MQNDILINLEDQLQAKPAENNPLINLDENNNNRGGKPSVDENNLKNSTGGSSLSLIEQDLEGLLFNGASTDASATLANALDNPNKKENLMSSTNDINLLGSLPIPLVPASINSPLNAISNNATDFQHGTQSNVMDSISPISHKSVNIHDTVPSPDYSPVEPPTRPIVATDPQAKSPVKKDGSRSAPIPAEISPVHQKLITCKWINPNVFLEVSMPDLLGETISKTFAHIPANQRPQKQSMTLLAALQTADPYKTLIDSNSWILVALLAKNDLIAIQPFEIDKIMQLWMLRWSALLKLRKVKTIEKEIQNIELFKTEIALFKYETYPEIFSSGNKTGTFFTLDLLILISKIPAFSEDFQQAIHRLYSLLTPDNQFSFKASRDEHFRILLHVASVLVLMQDLPMAIDVSTAVSEAYPNNVDILSMVGRLHLSVGDVASSLAVFDKIEVLLEASGPDDVSSPSMLNRPDLILSHRAFIALATDKVKQAMTNFTQLLTILPDSPSAINNLAMCHLYAGDVGQASSFLESFIVTHPEIGGSKPGLVFNLASMFDLTDSSYAKKRALLKVVVQKCGDDFDPAVFKF